MSSACSASLRHRCRNSQTWQWLLSVSLAGLASRPEPFQLVQHLFRLLVELHIQPNLPQPGLWAAGDQPHGGP